ncbi:hypothetical protein MCOR31_010891 [Pyricularia oryzae]|nr:hypothetical protein MCOR31_010891 [Pyricularia oryzae]
MAQSLIGFAIAVAVPQAGTETKTLTPSTDLKLPYDLGGTLAMVSVAMKRPSVVLENLPSFGDVKCADNNVIMAFKDVDYRVPLCTIDLPIYKGEARTQSFGNATGTPGLTSRKTIFGHQPH